MSSEESSGSGRPTSIKAPKLTSLQDLTIIEAWCDGRDSERDPPNYVTFYHITADDEIWFGQSFKSKREMTLDEFQAALERIPEANVYPEIPPNTKITLAPLEDKTNGPLFIKQPGLKAYEAMSPDWILKNVLAETLMMEKIYETGYQHPNIIKYFGCRTKHGRITSLVFERHEYTLHQYVSQLGFQHMNKEKFIDDLESAVSYVHSLGLAHNDICPYNVMIGANESPVLIDFGSCAPYGEPLGSCGSPGWYKEVFFTSEKDHDDFSMDKMREWIYNPEV